MQLLYKKKYKYVYFTGYLAFNFSSMEVNCESIAVMGATLANGGECPTTGEEVLSPEAVRDVLSLMHR